MTAPRALAGLLAAGFALAACAAGPDPETAAPAADTGGAAAAAGSAPDVPPGRWLLAGAGRFPGAGPDAPWVAFAADGSITGWTGCNSFAGRYEPVAGGVGFGQMRMTRRACSGAAAEREAAFMRLLSATVAVSVDRLERLVLTYPGGQAMMVRAG